MRRTLAVTALTGGIALALAAPALAAGLTSQQVSNAYSIMMTRAEAESLGVTKTMLSNFDVARSDKGTPDAPWLCDLSGAAEVDGNGAKNQVGMQYLSLEGTAVGSVSQEVHIYGNAAQAKKAYDGIVKRITRCEGQQQPESDEDGDADEGSGFTVQLTNGSKKAKDGDEFLWVRSNTTATGTDGFASHEYLTVRFFDRYLQIIEVESEGQDAKDLTAKQVRIADRLTDQLGDRWRTSFR